MGDEPLNWCCQKCGLTHAPCSQVELFVSLEHLLLRAPQPMRAGTTTEVRLGNDEIQTIAASLPFASRCRVLRVCKSWQNALLGSHLLWSHACFLGWCDRLDDVGVAAAIARAQGRLYSLDIRGARRVTVEVGLRGLRHCTGLRVLLLSGAWRVRMEPLLQVLQEGVPPLSVLVVDRLVDTRGHTHCNGDANLDDVNEDLMTRRRAALVALSRLLNSEPDAVPAPSGKVPHPSHAVESDEFSCYLHLPDRSLIREGRCESCSSLACNWGKGCAGCGRMLCATCVNGGDPNHATCAGCEELMCDGCHDDRCAYECACGDECTLCPMCIDEVRMPPCPACHSRCWMALCSDRYRGLIL